MKSFIETKVEELHIELETHTSLNGLKPQDAEGIRLVQEWLEQTLTELVTKAKEVIEEGEYNLNVDEYLKLVKSWDGKTYDQPFDDGCAHGKKVAQASLDELLSNK